MRTPGDKTAEAGARECVGDYSSHFPRRNEIGVRMALGALRRDVLQMIFGESLRIAAIGFAIGLPLSMGIAHLLRSQLYQLSSFDVTSLAVALGITLLVSLGSAFLPAHNAAQTNPMKAIRTE